MYFAPFYPQYLLKSLQEKVEVEKSCIFTQQWLDHEPAKTSVSPRSSPLGMFRAEERL